MGAEWFCQMAGRELGPLSSQQIKMMAASGRLQPADSIRQGANGPWLPAARVKGLFPAAGNSPARKNGQQAPAAKKPASANPSANGTKRAGGGQAAAPRSARAIVVPARQPRQTQQPAAAPSPAADFFDELACGIPEPKKGFNVGRLAIDSTPVKVAGRKSSRVGGMNKAERTQMMRIMGGVIGGALVLSVIMVAIYLLRGSGPASARPRHRKMSRPPTPPRQRRKTSRRQPLRRSLPRRRERALLPPRGRRRRPPTNPPSKPPRTKVLPLWRYLATPRHRRPGRSRDLGPTPITVPGRPAQRPSPQPPIRIGRLAATTLSHTYPCREPTSSGETRGGWLPP